MLTTLDSALLTALLSENDRMRLLRSEKQLAQFLLNHKQAKKKDPSALLAPYLDLRADTSSFSRLCVYRTALLFRMYPAHDMKVSTTVYPLLPVPPGIIRLYTTKKSKLPKQMLISIKREEVEEEVVRRRALGLEVLGNVESGSRVAPSIIPTKVAVNARVAVDAPKVAVNASAASHRQQLQQPAPPSRASIADREEAYAKARARIFENGKEGDGGAGEEDKERLARAGAQPALWRDDNADSYDEDFARHEGLAMTAEQYYYEMALQMQQLGVAQGQVVGPAGTGAPTRTSNVPNLGERRSNPWD